MTVERNRIGWVIWLAWVLVSTIGWMLGFIIGFVLAYVPGDLIAGALGDYLAYGVHGSVLGAVVGLMQWLILREYVSRAGWWVLASSAGLAVGYGVAVVALGSFAETVVVALGGTVTGILQWLILRRHFSRAGWWVLASTVGLGFSMAVSLDSSSMLLVGGAVLGAVTGGALVWLLRQPVPEA